MRLLLCFALLALPVLGQEAADTTRDSLSFGEIQEMLDRFGDTTMRTIEDQLRTKLDEYEQALDKSRLEESDEVIQPEFPITYRLTFTITGASEPMSILSTPGDYSLNAAQNRHEHVDAATTTGSSELECTGTVGPATTEGKVHVRFQGNSHLSQTEVIDGSQKDRDSTIDFDGSADIALGMPVEIACNDELRIVLQVDVLSDEPVVEQPATR